MSKLISVSEYAELTGKDPGNIRRLLSSGRLKGEKIGNQWVLSDDTPYPRDRRETTGKYKKHRKNTENISDIMAAVNEMVETLRSVYGSILSEIILYGSYARGTQKDESDIDIALIVSEKPSEKITNEMINTVASYEIKIGKVLSVIDIDEGKYRYWAEVLPFYKNIGKEGIVLWKAAA